MENKTTTIKNVHRDCGCKETIYKDGISIITEYCNIHHEEQNRFIERAKKEVM